MSKKLNATESLLYKRVATFSSGGDTADWNSQLSVFCVMAIRVCRTGISKLFCSRAT